MSDGGEILVVDDEEDIREVIVDLLERRGYRVAHADNGAEALASVEHEMPRLILLDVRMPVVDGEEFIRRFRARHGKADVRIVLMTAYSDLRRGDAPLEVDATVRKPFEVDELLATIEKTLGSHAQV